MSINYIISETRNSRIGQIILIGDRTTLLDYNTVHAILHTMDTGWRLELHFVVT